MNVESICSRQIVSVDGSEPLQRVALLMREHHVGTVIVTESRPDGEHVTGLVTDRDLAIEVLARGGDASQAPVSRLVQDKPLGVNARASLERRCRRWRPRACAACSCTTTKATSSASSRSTTCCRH